MFRGDGLAQIAHEPLHEQRVAADLAVPEPVDEREERGGRERRRGGGHRRPQRRRGRLCRYGRVERACGDRAGYGPATLHMRYVYVRKGGCYV